MQSKPGYLTQSPPRTQRFGGNRTEKQVTEQGVQDHIADHVVWLRLCGLGDLCVGFLLHGVRLSELRPPTLLISCTSVNCQRLSRLQPPRSKRGALIIELWEQRFEGGLQKAE